MQNGYKDIHSWLQAVAEGRITDPDDLRQGATEAIDYLQVVFATLETLGEVVSYFENTARLGIKLCEDNAENMHTLMDVHEKKFSTGLN